IGRRTRRTTHGSTRRLPVPIARSSPLPTSVFPALFSEYPNLIETSGRVNSLYHVVEREPCHADGGQRLHLHTRTVGAAHGRGDLDVRIADGEIDFNPGERELMAERNQVAGALCRQNARHPRGGHRTAL